MEPDLEQLVERFNGLGGMPWLNQPKTTKDALSRYSQLFLNDAGRSCHHKDDADQGQIVYKACPIQLETKTADDGATEFVIRGWASTSDKDLDDDIILPTAFQSSLAKFMAQGRMLFMHDWWALPVGKWDSAEIRDRGLWMERGIIAPTTMGLDLQILIGMKAINTLSVGFRVLKDEFNYDTGVRTITDLELLEVSIVNIPANPNAVFDMAKTKNLKSLIPNRSGNGSQKGKGNTMDPELLKVITAMSERYDVSAGPVADRLTKMSTTVDNINRILMAVKAQADKALDPKDAATKADLLQFMDNTKTDITGLVADMKALQAAKKEDGIEKMIVTDWRAMLSKGIFMRDVNGKALSAAHQKAFRILNLPVDYDKSEHGPIIKAARNLNDVTMIQDAFFRKTGKAPGGGQYQGMHTLESFQKLAEVMEILDAELGASMKAMYTGGAGLGLEWIPTIFSGEFDTLYRLRPTLVNYLRPAWQMPSATAKWPILSGAATAYLADEAATNNPAVLLKSNLTTAVVTFVARTLATAIPVSRQLLEDSIVDVAMVIREELAIALAEAEENADINGDNTATHFDTGTALTSADADVMCAWKGLRKLAVGLSNTWDSQSATAGIGDGTTAFAAQDVRYNRQKLGILGLNPSECLHITSIGAYYKALAFTQVTKANEFGYQSTWLSGVLPALDGVEIYISGHMREDLNASGIYDNSTKTHTGWLTIHRRSFMPGEKRGVNLEFEYNAEVQQWLFISTMRRDFQNMRPSTQLPVAYAYNIEN